MAEGTGRDGSHGPKKRGPREPSHAGPLSITNLTKL